MADTILEGRIVASKKQTNTSIKTDVDKHETFGGWCQARRPPQIEGPSNLVPLHSAAYEFDVDKRRQFLTSIICLSFLLSQLMRSSQNSNKAQQATDDVM